MFPILESKRMILREINENDVEDVFDIFSNNLVMQYYGQNSITLKDQAREFIQHFNNIRADKKGIRWGIESKDEKGLIGTVGFHLWSPKHNRAEIGYEIHPNHWRKGVLSEVLPVVLEYGFNEMKLNRIGAIVYKENLKSIKLLESAGFQKEGILKEYMYQDGKYFDTYSYSILKNITQ